MPELTPNASLADAVDAFDEVQLIDGDRERVEFAFAHLGLHYSAEVIADDPYTDDRCRVHSIIRVHTPEGNTDDLHTNTLYPLTDDPRHTFAVLLREVVNGANGERHAYNGMPPERLGKYLRDAASNPTRDLPMVARGRILGSMTDIRVEDDADQTVRVIVEDDGDTLVDTGLTLITPFSPENGEDSFSNEIHTALASNVFDLLDHGSVFVSSPGGDLDVPNPEPLDQPAARPAD